MWSKAGPAVLLLLILGHCLDPGPFDDTELEKRLVDVIGRVMVHDRLIKTDLEIGYETNLQTAAI